MSQMTRPTAQVSCFTEYHPLTQVIVCSPERMKIREVINRTQRYFVQAEGNIDARKAVNQHDHFCQTLQQNGVEVIFLPSKQLPEQVFTRDIAFVLHHSLFIARLDRDVRQGEEQVLKDWLTRQHIPFEEMQEGSIEGGDVIIDRDTVWVGRSDRTSSEAIQALQDRLPELEVKSVPFDPKYLHLDCVFNVVSEREALIFPPAFKDDQMKAFAARYELIEVSAEEQFTLGTNVLSIGRQKVISLPTNKRVNEQLRLRGYTVIEVDIGEIIKSGGSFRCITMPLKRR